MTEDFNITRRAALVLAAGALSLGLAGPALAEVDFAGETIEWIIPFSAGGGSDTWARFNAPLLSKYLPGEPTVIVVNEPGGGSTKGTNLFAARAKPDGLTILGTSGSTQFPYLLGDPRVRYDYKEWKIAMVDRRRRLYHPDAGAEFTRRHRHAEGQGAGLCQPGRDLA